MTFHVNHLLCRPLAYNSKARFLWKIIIIEIKKCCLLQFILRVKCPFYKTWFIWLFFFLKAQTSAESKTNPEEKLLRPSWLTQGSTAIGKKTSEQEGKHSEEKLHPSWLASKKRKEQQTSIPAFQGKRIKFDWNKTLGRKFSIHKNS